MSDSIWQRREIESPCKKICLIHPDAGICVGCYRTPKEIAEWGDLPPQKRQAIMAELGARASLTKKRRGGRKARTP